MTLLSGLVGGVGGGVTPYIPGNLYHGLPAANNGAAITADRDYITPIQVRVETEIDAVIYRRMAGANAGTVYVGICDLAGNLLTNCSGDTDTTTGVHAVSTTPITLLPGVPYLGVGNSSAATLADTFSLSSGDYTADLGLTPLGGLIGVGYWKSRTSAALLSTITLSSLTALTNAPFFVGFRAS